MRGFRTDELFDIHTFICKLEESGETDVKIRTIHYYAGKKLLRPHGLGRSARYDRSHILKYKLIRMMQQAHYSLEKIKDFLEHIHDYDTVREAYDRFAHSDSDFLSENRVTVASRVDEMDLHENPDYSEEKFWGKIKEFALSAGVKVVYSSLVLFCSIRNPDIPKTQKTIIIGALAYFIIPLDAVPDFTPAFGFSDDFGAIAGAITLVKMHINQGVIEKAREIFVRNVQSWFSRNRNFESELNEIDEYIRK